MTKEPAVFRENSEAVRAHLTILQSVIQRMASNSASSKAWCITLVSAVLVVVANKEKPDYVWIALIPTVLFLTLDAYYLALEKGFRESYNIFIHKLHDGSVVAADVYAVKPSGKFGQHFFDSIISFSVWGPYVALYLMVLLARKLVL